MPTAARREPPPLVQITWTTKKKDRTRTVAITLGSPLLALLLLLGGSQLAGVQKVTRTIWTALCMGR
jgi:hypothetical protein